MPVCSICNKEYKGFGNNAYPINDGRCCDPCNSFVIVRRLQNMMAKERMNNPPTIMELAMKAAKAGTKIGAVAIALMAVAPRAEAGQTLDQVNRQYNQIWQQQRESRYIYEHRDDARKQQETLDKIERNTRKEGW